MNQGFTNALLLLTTACPIGCEHCQYSCTPEGKWVPDYLLLKFAKESKANGICTIRISGGEPFLNITKLKKAITIMLNYYQPSALSIVTSGFWAINKKETERTLNVIRKLGIRRIYLSFDRFHLRKIKLENILNILETSSKLGIKVILRSAFDKYSSELSKTLTEIITKYKTDLLFSYTEPFGRGELLKKDALLSVHTATQHFLNDFKNRQSDNTSIERSEKMGIRMNNPNSFSITMFPTGNVYGCCIAMKLTYLGNLTQKSLNRMLEDYKKTIPGYSFFNTNSCKFLTQLTLQKLGDRCNICRNQPFLKKASEEYVGRQYIVIKNFDKLPNSKKELLLSFELKEGDLNTQTGIKIKDFLKKLEQTGQRFKISKPLPKCLFGLKYQKIMQKYYVPKDCFECDELFSVEDGFFMGCASVGVKGPGLDLSFNRRKIWSFFNHVRLKKKPLDRCKRCKYFIRRNCDGLCFRK